VQPDQIRLANLKYNDNRYLRKDGTAAQTVTGDVYFAGDVSFSALDRLTDQLGTVLLQGVSDTVHLITGKTISADRDMEINVVRDFELNVTRYLDIVSTEDVVFDFRTSLDQIVADYYDLDVGTDFNVDVANDMFLVIGNDSSITVTGSYQINGLVNAGVDTDKFLVLDSSNNVDYRTGTELLSDIGAASATHGVTVGYLPYAPSATAFNESNVFYDVANGRIGIGTAVPTARLHIVDGMSYLRVAESVFQTSKMNIYFSNNYGFIGQTGTGTNKDIFFVDTLNNVVFGANAGGWNSIQFRNGSAEASRVTITSANNVGIGILLPKGKLDICYGGTGIFIGADDGAATRTDNTIKYSKIASSQYDNDEEGASVISTLNTSTINEIDIGGGVSTFNASTLIKFYTAANNTTLSGTERMRINEAGNVGIGISVPNRRLEVSVEDAVTNAVTYAQRLSHFTSGSAANGIGTGLEFVTEDLYSTVVVLSTIEAVGSDGMEDSHPKGDLVFKTYNESGDGLSERMRITYDRINVYKALQLMTGLNAFVTSSSNPWIYRSATTGVESEPFSSNGNLVLQSRSSVSGTGIYFATGTTPTTKLKISDDGTISIKDNNITDINTLTFHNTSNYIIRLEEDDDTGIYYRTDIYTWGFRKSGVEVVTIDLDNGNLGIYGILNIGTCSEYTDNAAAIAGGLSVGTLYRTGDALKIVH